MASLGLGVAVRRPTAGEAFAAAAEAARAVLGALTASGLAPADIQTADIDGVFVDVGKHRVRRPNLVAIAQGFNQQPVAAGANRSQMFASAHGDLAQAHLPGLAQRIAHDAVRILCRIVGRQQIMGRVMIQRRDVGLAGELNQLERLFSSPA
jgi:hypothetical protein